MIKLILEMLQLDEHYGQSETIEIAKGKYELPETFLASSLTGLVRIMGPGLLRLWAQL